MNMIDVTPPPPAPRKPTLMQRLLVGTGIDKVARNIIASVGNSNEWFGPGQPIAQQGPPQQEGRALDYRVGYNQTTTPRDMEPVSMQDLWLLAENYDIVRLLIETRKDQVEALKWSVRVIREEGDDETETTDEQKERIKTCINFLKRPDGETEFVTWTRMLLEDCFVFDAASIFVNTDDPRNTKFEVISGATIKRLIDINGRTPAPPDPAYQQIIKGMPAWNYTREQLIYAMRNPRPNRIYGMSPVQQIVLTVNIALRKQMSQLEYFTQGNIPDALISVPPEWTPGQIAEFQTAWDAIMEGNTGQRRHAKFVPGGTNIEQTKEAVLKDEFDEWLTRICCYAFSISPSSFTKDNNRATAQTAKAAAKEEGLMPILEWLKRIFDLMLQKYLGQYDLEFAWEEDDEEDPQVKVQLLDTQLAKGAITLDEYRKAMGRAPYEGGLGAKPMIFNGTGATLLEHVINPPKPGEPGGPPLMPPGFGGGFGGGGFGGDRGERPGLPKPGQEAGGDKEPRPAMGAGGMGEPDTKEAVAAAPSGPALLKGVGVKTLYIHRKLVNSGPFLEWAKEQGFTKALPAEELHATIAYSKDAVDWTRIPKAPDQVKVSTGSRGIVEFGSGAIVLKFGSLQFSNRWNALRDIGCSWAWPTYQPHITITYDAGDLDLDSVIPYDGVLIFGPEVVQEIKEDWMANVEERTLKARRWKRSRDLIIPRR